MEIFIRNEIMARTGICSVILALFVAGPVLCFRTYTKDDVLRLREEVRDMFQHAYEGYLKYAGDYDELRPLSCDGIDTWGSYSLTLIDALDTLAVMGNFSEFRRVVNVLTKKTNFDADINVSVFETNIRIVGGLLGAHLMSLRAGVDVEPGWPCNGPLLRLAEDVAKRLLPAFDTKTGMPYGTVNLRHGVPAGETTVTCTAGVGTFIVEFGALSRLTGDPIYEEVALNALYALWKHRSPIGLFGNHIDVQTGRWTAQDAGIGAGVDSYYEYLVKGALMLNRPELLEMFHTGRKAIDKYLKRDDWHVWVSMNKGQVTLPVFQSLEAYWPGVLSLIGDIAPAMKTLHNYHSVWKQYGFLPEFYNIPSAEAGANRENYPLRPELIESVMYLYRATSDPYLLEVGEDMLRSIQYSAKTTCGYATIKNVRDHRKEDRMESFFLAETTKYLYLLFDPDNFLNNDGREGLLHETPNGICVIHAGGYIFNTEAHPIDPSALRCCHDNSDWFKDFKIEKFLGDELELKKDDDVTIGCGANQPPIPSNTENLTIEIETTVDSDETRQKMIAEIMDILKRMENETSEEEIKAAEREKEAMIEQRKQHKKDVDNVFKEAFAAERGLETIVKVMNDQDVAKLHSKLIYTDTKTIELLSYLESVVEDYLRHKNITAKDVLNETNKNFLENLTVANQEPLKHKINAYQNIAYHAFLLNVFKSLHALQKQHLQIAPENIAKSAANVLHSLKSGISESVLKTKYPEIVEIFGSAQEKYEKLLAKNNLTIAFYTYASRLHQFMPLQAKDMGKVVSLIELTKDEKKRLEKAYNEVVRGSLNLSLFDRVYDILTRTTEFNVSATDLLKSYEQDAMPGKEYVAKEEGAQDDDIILVDNAKHRNAESNTKETSSADEKTIIKSPNKEKNIEPDTGEGFVEPVDLDAEEQSTDRPSMKMKEEQVENASKQTTGANKPVLRQPEIQPSIEENTNNSLLTDFVQTLLKSTMPAKAKFEPQLLLEKIRANGIYNHQPQNFELLTCRAQPFLQRVSINGEFF